MRLQKKNNSSMRTIALPLMAAAIVLLGCGLTDRIARTVRPETEVRVTRTPLPTYTATVDGANFVGFEGEQNNQNVEIILATDTPTVVVVEPTPVPVEPTATPVEVAESTAEEAATEADSGEEVEAAPIGPATSVTIIQNMNVRGGPGTNYPVIGSAPAGAGSSILGRNGDGSWLKVEYPPGSGSAGWVYASLVETNGDNQGVAVAEIPPLPTPVPTEPPPPTPVPAPKYQFTPGAWHASANAAIVHFKGRIRDEGGNNVNGFSVYVSNGAWGTISHPSGPSGWYPDKGEGEWDVSGIGLIDGQGTWYLSVVSYDCNFWGGFDAQCKEFTYLSEEIPIIVKTPEESIINADWVCHWDCNKGVYQ